MPNQPSSRYLRKPVPYPPGVAILTTCGKTTRTCSCQSTRYSSPKLRLERPFHPRLTPTPGGASPIAPEAGRPPLRVAGARRSSPPFYRPAPRSISRPSTPAPARTAARRASSGRRRVGVHRAGLGLQRSRGGRGAGLGPGVAAADSTGASRGRRRPRAARNGMFGPRTRAAVRGWQSSRGGRATGYLDGPAAEALRSGCASGPAVGAVATPAARLGAARRGAAPGLGGAGEPVLAVDHEQHQPCGVRGVSRAVPERRVQRVGPGAAGGPAVAGGGCRRVGGTRVGAAGTPAPGERPVLGSCSPRFTMRSISSSVIVSAVPVVQLRRLRRRVAGDPLGVLEHSPVR